MRVVLASTWNNTFELHKTLVGLVWLVDLTIRAQEVGRHRLTSSWLEDDAGDAQTCSERYMLLVSIKLREHPNERKLVALLNTEIVDDLLISGAASIDAPVGPSTDAYSLKYDPMTGSEPSDKI